MRFFVLPVIVFLGSLSLVIYMGSLFNKLPNEIVQAKQQLNDKQKELLLTQNLLFKKQFIKLSLNEKEFVDLMQFFFRKDDLFSVIKYLENKYQNTNIKITSIKQEGNKIILTVRLYGKPKDIFTAMVNFDKGDKLFFIEQFNLNFDNENGLLEGIFNLKTYAFPEIVTND